MTMKMYIMMNTKICTVKLTCHALTAGAGLGFSLGGGKGFIFGGGPTRTSEHKNTHCSAVKWPLVSISAIWSLVWMYLPKTEGSVETLSNNQSKSIRCVRGTCLSVGARLLTTILMTASLSCTNTIFVLASNTGNDGGTQSTYSSEIVS